MASQGPGYRLCATKNDLRLDSDAPTAGVVRFSAELVGTNLNDRCYADPLTRSLMPAPGRTVRLSLTGRF